MNSYQYSNTLASYETLNEKLFADHYYNSWTRAYKEGRKEVIKMEFELIEETESVLNSMKDELKKTIDHK
ncbi:hypothetical protein [Algoriphagus marinus]|uniref:hypothetical protein n=1 Tax=Algoriphagus marinus TaxID=1925762 RepID=UPI00094BBB61|nr:hypothetical protein [Algoriphagus marinus]